MSVAIDARRPQIGGLLREWRERRRLSQLDLALQAEISTRHLSFVETGRSRPSSEMILRLTDQLDVPLRERNRLLLAAGYAPFYAETALDSPHMDAVRVAVRQVLVGHEPFPAVAVDRAWNIVDANESSTKVFLEGVAPDLLQPPVNALRVALHPDGLAARIINLGEWRAHLLGRVRRELASSADARLAELYSELRGYPCDQVEPEPDWHGPGGVVVPLRIRFADRELEFLSMVASFGTPRDITVDELAIESFFPADQDTAATLRRVASE